MTYQAIICLIIIATILLFYISRKVHLNKIISKNIADDDQELREEDLKLYKEKKKKEMLKRQLLLQSYNKDDLKEADINDTKIVSVVEPIGKWTRLVMNEHFMKLINLKQERKGGFWQIFVSMQGMMQGKSRYKGR